MEIDYREEENHKTFMARLGLFADEDRFLIDFAYDLAKAAHSRQVRDSGERYFEHLRSVALILLDELKVKDSKLVVAALLHDSIEDTVIFGHSLSSRYSEWRNIAARRLTKIFNWDTANMIIALTEPKVDGVEILDKEQAKKVYMQNMSDSSPDTILIKMCDRLHNLRSLGSVTPEKRERKLQETRELYFPLFQKVMTEYPEEGKYLLAEMEKAMAALAN